MAKIDQIAQTYLNRAAANPGQKHEICREAAYTFMGLAQHPKNVRASKQLAEVGLTFARAAGDSRPPVMDDFADILEETRAAYEQAGSWGDDPMDLIAARREIHDARTPQNPGQVFITPESFNRDATLGRSQKIKWQPTDEEKRNDIQQSQTVAFWQGVKKEAQAMSIDINLVQPPSIETIAGPITISGITATLTNDPGNIVEPFIPMKSIVSALVGANLTLANVGDSIILSGFANPANNGTFVILEVLAPDTAVVSINSFVFVLPDANNGSGMWTLITQSSVTSTGAAASAPSARPFADIEFGSDGNKTHVKVDLGLGHRLTVVGNYIAVSVGMDPPALGRPSPVITAGASIGAFAAPSLAPVIRTIYAEALLAGSSSPITLIPYKAVLLLPIVSSLAVGDTSNIEFFDFGGISISKVYFTQSITQMTPVPVPADASFVRVNNTATSGVVNFRLPFQLAM